MILHLASQQTGGAAIAALRIHQALLEAGVESRFLAGAGAIDPARNIDVVPKVYERFWVRGLHNIGISTTQYRKWQRTRAQNGLPDTVLSGIRSDYRLGAHQLVEQAKIIHLHWVTGMFDWPDFFSRVQKPIVWTLHDMNPFLGIFHYEGDMSRASSKSHTLERSLRRQKTALIRSHTKIVCVAPSRWLSEKAKASEAFKDCEHRVIQYALNTDVFRTFPREIGREVFGLSQDKNILLVVAERLDDYRKGMDLLNEGLAKSELGRDWEVVAVGKGDSGKAPIKLHQVGSIHDARLMALLYSTADLFVIPSREDNFPNTIVESLCCGTPVVGLPAGGIPEAVHAPRDGVIAAEISSNALAMALKRASDMRFDRAAIRDQAVQRFGQDNIAKQYADLYDRLA